MLSSDPTFVVNKPQGQIYTVSLPVAAQFVLQQEKQDQERKDTGVEGWGCCETEVTSVQVEQCLYG